ncbi:MAG: hypothetical protein COB15_07465 [Flavobacteriales bacterium]|nr:MAG: hypothetical protein COB15_07465 [Flavobacteriales bacterium]
MKQYPAIELDSAKIWVCKDSIIWQDYKLTRSITIKEAKEISEAVNEIAENVPDGKKLLLSSMVGLLTMSSEVRDYFTNYPTKYDWKIALVYSNSVAHVFTLLILKVLSSRFESKSFNNLENAIDWLKKNR